MIGRSHMFEVPEVGRPLLPLRIQGTGQHEAAVGHLPRGPQEQLFELILAVRGICPHVAEVALEAVANLDPAMHVGIDAAVER